MPDAPPMLSDVGAEVIAGQRCHATASFSACRTYRYRLTRSWDASRPRVLWLMLNPSTADAMKLDPTIRRCAGYAMAWGFGSLEVVNLFAFRATNPRELERDLMPVGERDADDLEVNDRAIRDAAAGARLIVAGWGAFPLAAKRAREVQAMLVREGRILTCIGFTKDLQPVHPLYQKADARPIPFAWPSTLNPAEVERLAAPCGPPAAPQTTFLTAEAP